MKGIDNYAALQQSAAAKNLQHNDNELKCWFSGNAGKSWNSGEIDWGRALHTAQWLTFQTHVLTRPK